MPELLPYQEEGRQFLAARRFALLADQMRLGKTPQSITAADSIGARTVIVATVAVGVWNWARQWEQWSILSPAISVIQSTTGPVAQEGVIIGSFAMISSDPARLPEADLLIIDEAHFLKSLDAGRTGAILGKNGVIHKARRTWFLTGTPSPNGLPGEMWTMLFVCGLTRLSYADFEKRYTKGFQCRINKHSSQTRFKPTGLQNVEEFRGLLDGFMLRRRWDQVMSELPKIEYQNVVVPAGEVDVEIYFFDWWMRDRGASLRLEVEKQSLALEALYSTASNAHASLRATSNALEFAQPAFTTLRRFTALQKMEALFELITGELDADPDLKLIVFFMHRDPMVDLFRRMENKYGRHCCVQLYGGTPPEKKREHLDRFKTKKKCRLFIGQIQAAGTNIDLSHCNEIIMAEMSWVPGDNAQAIMRCHNIFQTRPVRVRFVGLANHIDEKVTQTEHKKTRQVLELLD